jgi:hypothetical protein
MAGCLLVILSAMMPRLVIIVIAIATNWISMAYETTIWPLLGWLFMPFTTLAYMAAMLNNNHEVSGGWIILMIVAVLMDLGGNSSGRTMRSDD